MYEENEIPSVKDVRCHMSLAISNHWPMTYSINKTKSVSIHKQKTKNTPPSKSHPSPCDIPLLFARVATHTKPITDRL